jgi:hypothetical protein
VVVSSRKSESLKSDEDDVGGNLRDIPCFDSVCAACVGRQGGYVAPSRRLCSMMVGEAVYTGFRSVSR